MPYVELQKLLDEANAWGLHACEEGMYIEDLTGEVAGGGFVMNADMVAEHVPRKTSPMSVLLFYRLDGAYGRVGDDETAFSGGR